MLDMAAALDDQRLEALFGQLLGGPAAAHSRADDDRVEHLTLSFLKQPKHARLAASSLKLPTGPVRAHISVPASLRLRSGRQREHQFFELPVDLVAGFRLVEGDYNLGAPGTFECEQPACLLGRRLVYLFEQCAELFLSLT